MSTDCRIFVLSNALMKVSGCVLDIICMGTDHMKNGKQNTAYSQLTA